MINHAEIENLENISDSSENKLSVNQGEEILEKISQNDNFSDEERKNSSRASRSSHSENKIEAENKSVREADYDERSQENQENIEEKSLEGNCFSLYFYSSCKIFRLIFFFFTKINSH
jgi:hypothetical protein